jgi:HAD superfamily hydrolase (TIGR01509 family)
MRNAEAFHARWSSCKAVVFDLDGTLIDTEPFYRTAFHAAALAFGVDVPPELYTALIGLATDERRPVLRRAFGPGFPIDAFVVTYYEQRALHLPARIPLCAGAAGLLRCVRRPKAVATSASRRTALSHMCRAGLRRQFVHVVTRDDVPRGKPAPDAFNRAAALLGLAPANCVAIEDSAIGVAAAHGAGMPVIMVAPIAPPETRRRCLAVVPSLDAISNLLHSRAPLREPYSGFIRSDGARKRPVTHSP